MIGISSSWLAAKGMSIKNAVEKEIGLGFELIEIGAAHRYEEGAIDTALEMREKYPTKSFMLHALFPPYKNGSYPLNLADPQEHDRTIKAVKKMFDITERLGSDIIGIHGGYAGKVKWVGDKPGFKELVAKDYMPAEEAMRNMKIVVEDLLSIAEEKNIRFAIEISPSDKNTANKSASMMTNPESFKWLFSNFKSKYIGVLLDIGHLHISASREKYDPYSFVRTFRKRIFEMHIHDCKDSRDHVAIGTGEIDFNKYFKIIGKGRLEKIPLVFEYNSPVTEKQALEGRAIIERLLAGLKTG